MGIKNFGAIVRKTTDGVSKKTFADFSGETWAIDGSIFLYKFAHNAQQKKPNSHVDGFYKMFLRLLKFKIRPVLVLDGKSPAEKSHTREMRTLSKQKNIDKAERISEEISTLLTNTESNVDTDVNIDSEINQKKEELQKINKQIINFSPSMYEDIRHLCSLIDVPVLRASGEADALCAKLYLTGQVNAIMSEDSDMLLFGGGRLIRKVTYTDDVELLELDKMLASLNITHKQFIDLSILCGTDYTAGGISGMGATTALDLIQKGNTIETIIEKLDPHRVPSDDIFSYQNARKYINGACGCEQNIIINKFDFRSVNGSELTGMMTHMCNYRQNTIQKHMYQLADIFTPPKPKIKIIMKNLVK